MTKLEDFIYNNGYVTAEREEQVEENLRAFVRLVRNRAGEISSVYGTYSSVYEAFNEIVKEFGLEYPASYSTNRKETNAEKP